jgi:hypothetical protein
MTYDISGRHIYGAVYGVTYRGRCEGVRGYLLRSLTPAHTRGSVFFLVVNSFSGYKWITAPDL